MQQQPRAKLADAQWQRLQPLPPGKPTDPGRAGFNNRKTVEGILWRDRAGAPWRARPPYFGKGNTLHKRFRRWVKAGSLPGCLTPCRRTCSAHRDGGRELC